MKTIYIGLVSSILGLSTIAFVAGSGHELFATRSPDGRLHLAAGADGRIIIRDVVNRSSKRTFYHCMPAAAAFSHDSKLVLTVGLSSSSPFKLKLWDVRTGKLVRDFEIELEPKPQL